MGTVFLVLLNRSIAAGWLILAVLALRILLHKAPRQILCLLWAVAAVRLICPVSLKSPLSLIPSPETLSPYTVRFSQNPGIDSGISVLDHTLNPILQETFEPSPYASVNPLYVFMFLCSILWAAGVFVLLLCACISFLRIQKNVRESIPLRDNIRLCDRICSPFILGLFHPRIYLPSDMDEELMPSVLAHEQAHLKRLDHWWKPLACLLLAIYWFHPLMWIACILFCRDIELACDEKVIRELTPGEKKAYSHALVSCSRQQRLVITCPLAFGEAGVKQRVKMILQYKKPAVWLLAAAAAACIATAVCFLTDPMDELSANPEVGEETFLIPEDEFPSENSTPAFSAESGPDHAESEAKDTDSAAFSLEQAARTAILEHNASSGPEKYDLACSDFAILGTEPQNLSGTENEHVFTVYGWALYEEYKISEAGIEDVGGSHIPVALTFEQRENDLVLTEYWEPGDGSYFTEDIRNRFPAELAADGIDSQKFIRSQIQSCRLQAATYSGLDTDAVIGRLLDTICSAPAASSAPRDYADAHAPEYQELIYYGGCTLQYCFRRFAQGGETGLEGRIMALVCEDLLQTRGTLPADAGTAPTGQFWYDTLCAHGSSLAEP